ncbi:hypothetical protein TRFO_17308 [Tritrichomonas foetus]|uniref:Protein kinase domain-containing protein n=1 Tax=Tritrichomonas foetus TaxID=1144522 RepID=A0A1J4KNF0_9EUKA|nr:hypothetical protein TRFO_17308 [Tritrichomonas foetus]|eukprot:OHT12763.1 hypothetical protein TRFO_17308 [Tritrichomonas foetus]
MVLKKCWSNIDLRTNCPFIVVDIFIDPPPLLKNQWQYILSNQELIFSRIYDKFNLNYIGFFDFNCRNALLHMTLKTAFLTLGYLKVTERDYNLFILCFEDNCIFIKDQAESYFWSFIQNYLVIGTRVIYHFDLPFDISAINKNLSDSEKCSAEEEVFNFIKFFYHKISNNAFLLSTLKPLISYLVRRFYFPPKYFRNSAYLDTFYSIIYQEFHINDFVTLRSLGKGSTSNVYLFFHLETFYIVAAKEYIGEFSEKVERREKIFASIINSEDVCLNKTYGFIYDKQRKRKLYLYEFMSGGTLETNVNWLSDTAKTELMIKLLYSIYILHSNNLIHRDLKPDNILFNFKGKSFLSDFGCIRNEYETGDFTNNLGSFYSSPEILLKNGNEINESSDIYSFGLLLYFLSNRRNPCISFSNLLKNYVNGKVPIFAGTDKIKNVYEKCVCFNPKDRADALFLLQYIVNNHLYFENTNIPYINSKIRAIISMFKDHDDVRIEDISVVYESSLIPEGIRLLESGDFVNAKQFFKVAKNEDHDEKGNIQLGHLYLKKFKETRNSKYLDKGMKYIELPSNYNDNTIVFAFNTLGDIFYDGKFVQQDIYKAIYFYEKGVKISLSKLRPNIHLNKENIDAVRKLGKFYFDQKYTKKAKKYLEMITHKKDKYFQVESVEEDYMLGIIYLKNPSIASREIRIQNILKYLLRAANEKHSDAQYQLGKIYFRGDIVEKNPVLAEHFWYLASSFNAKAQYYLGLAYLFGEYGIEKNVNNGIELLLKSADNGYIKANYQVGLFYQEGYETNKDPKTALIYFKNAEILNSKMKKIDQQLMIKIFENLYEITEYDEALTYLEKLLPYEIINSQKIAHDFDFNPFYLVMPNIVKIMSNLSSCIYELGKYYKNKNASTSIYLIYIAAKLRHPQGLYKIGKAVFEGKNIEKNEKTGIAYLEGALEHKNFKALDYLVKICKIYQYNDSIFSYHEYAAKYNCIVSIYFLGVSIENGIHYPKNFYNAIEYYQKIITMTNTKKQYNKYKQFSINRYCLIYLLKTHNFNHVISLNMMKSQSSGDFSYLVNNIGIIYYFYEKNIELAKIELKKAAANGFILSEIILGLLFEEESNQAKANKYYNLGINHYFSTKILLDSDYGINDFDHSCRFLVFYIILKLVKKTIEIQNMSLNNDNLSLIQLIRDLLLVFQELLKHSEFHQEQFKIGEFHSIFSSLSDNNQLLIQNDEPLSERLVEEVRKWLSNQNLIKLYHWVSAYINQLTNYIYQKPYYYFFGTCPPKNEEKIYFQENLYDDFREGFGS